LFEAEINPDKVKDAELVVGIPSYREAALIAHPTIQANEGLVKYFPGKGSVIINCDNDSPDNTRDAFLNTPTQVPKIYLSTPPGVTGKGNNLRNLFRKAVELNARAVVVVDADLRSITPEWIRHLAEPVFSGFSFVSPLYVGHKYNGTLANGIVYPLLRSLYGRRLRQPTGGESAFSGSLARVFLSSDLWDDRSAYLGIDIWMTTLALNAGVRCCQAFMGGPKVHRSMDMTATTRGLMFKQVVGTLFSLMPRFEDFWLRVKYSKPTPIQGLGSGEKEIPPRVDLDTEGMIQAFYRGFALYGHLWERMLSSDLYNKLLEIKGLRKALFSFPTDLWARIVYDTAISSRDAVAERDEMMNALIPLFYGRTYSFVRKTRRMSTRQAEETVEEDCTTFEMTKPYLVRRWQETR
jgi:glucosylglycerate synthase